jgi:hypothetical protein
MFIVLGILGGAGYGAYAYYTSTQATIATLRENNAKLEVALETATESLAVMEATVEKTNKLNKQLQTDLQAAEAYSDELRSKFSRLNLVQEALRDSEILEGKMNGATANLWREIMGESGSSDGSSRPLPSWLQRPEETRDGDQSSNEDSSDDNPDSSTAKTNTVE